MEIVLTKTGIAANVEVSGNYFHDLPFPAIVDVHSKRVNVNIHNNKIVNCE
jgi:hypothetical protein